MKTSIEESFWGRFKLAVDKISGVSFLRVRLALGAEGVDDGDVSHNNPIPVEIVSDAGADRELVVATYRAKTAFTGASVGDTITMTQIIDVSGTPSTVSTIWRNQTTAADLAGAPSSADLELVGSQALTDAQLRASAVSMKIDQAMPGSTNAVSVVGRITKTDRSGSITAGGSAQALMAANANRLGWQLQNNSNGDLWFNEVGSTAVAAQPSFKLAPGDSYESPVGATSTAAISIIGATTGQTFTAREW
jgi:hypothetical protein